jgi:eukaryotic-like serine/threonine-protein kinase
MRLFKQIIISPWMLCPLLALLLLSASLLEMPTLSRLESSVFDQLMTFRKTESVSKVVLIATDQSGTETQETKGKRLSGIINKVVLMGPESVALLSAPAEFDLSNLPQHNKGIQIRLPLNEKDHDSQISNQRQQFDFFPDQQPLPSMRELFISWNNPLVQWRQDRPPESTFQYSEVSQTGHLIFTPDSDGKIRQHTLLLPSRGKLIPSLPLQLYLQNFNIAVKDIALPIAGLAGTIRGAQISIPIHGFYQQWLEQGQTKVPFQTYTREDVLEDKISIQQIRDKIVLIGPIKSYGDKHQVASYGSLSTSELTALATATLFNTSSPIRPEWAWLVESITLLYFTLLLLLLIPRLSFYSGLTSLLFFLTCWIAVGTSGLIFFNIQLKLIPALLVCLFGFLLIQWQKSRRHLEYNIRENKMIRIQRFKEQGLLDLAQENALQFFPRSKEDKDLLYNLGREFERKRMPDNAISIYRHLLNFGNFRDTKKHLKEIQFSQQPPPLGNSEKTIVLHAAGQEKPTLGRYRIEQELGHGAMGIVYLGVDPKINRKVAIKTLPYADIVPTKLKETKERFFHEAEAAGKLTHPHIVTIYDVGEESDMAFLAMELLQGDDLSRFCHSKNSLSVNQIINIIKQVADALAYAHQHEVIHRDIKPANIIMQKNDQIKVADFGIARMSTSSQTETGIIMGTPSYMSPEQISGKKVDGRSDLFSLGIVMYELLSGTRPFQGNDLTELLHNITRSNRIPLNEIRPKLPPSCYAIVDKLLQKTLTRRYKSASLLSKDLESLQQEMGES